MKHCPFFVPNTFVACSGCPGKPHGVSFSRQQFMLWIFVFLDVCVLGWLFLFLFLFCATLYQKLLIPDLILLGLIVYLPQPEWKFSRDLCLPFFSGGSQAPIWHTEERTHPPVSYINSYPRLKWELAGWDMANRNILFVLPSAWNFLF